MKFKHRSPMIARTDACSEHA